MAEIRNLKSVLVIEYWNLRFNCNLVLGIWDSVGAVLPELPVPGVVPLCRVPSS